MPSLHIGWALWCAAAIVTLARRRWVRILGALYPLATFFVIVGTANHYVLDAVAGAATFMAAVLVQRLLSGRRTFRRMPDEPATASEDRALVTV
jgi:PAP2 superfamily